MVNGLNDYEKFAISNGISTTKIDDYKKYGNIISPTIIEERSLNVATMDVFSRLMAERIIFLGTEINSDVANIVTSQLMYLNSVDKESDIKLFINSPGGSCTDGLAIYDIMNLINCDVATYCMGMAASMGSVILSSGTKGKRYSLPSSKIMIHQVSTAIGRVKASDLLIETEETVKLQNYIYNILAQNTNKTFEQIENDAKSDKWFISQEALDYGLIDEIIKKK